MEAKSVATMLGLGGRAPWVAVEDILKLREGEVRVQRSEGLKKRVPRVPASAVFPKPESANTMSDNGSHTQQHGRNSNLGIDSRFSQLCVSIGRFGQNVFSQYHSNNIQGHSEPPDSRQHSLQHYLRIVTLVNFRLLLDHSAPQ